MVNDFEKLRLEFEKSDVRFTIQTVFGDEPVMRFTNNEMTLKDVLETVFPRDWDDIWLALTVGVEQKRILLKHGKNHFTEFKRMNKLLKFQDNIITSKMNDNGDMIVVVDSTASNITDMFADSELATDTKTMTDYLYVWLSAGGVVTCLNTKPCKVMLMM